MIVAIDPESGELVPASPEQVRALVGDPAEAFLRSTEGLVEFRRPDGTVGVVVGERFQDYTVVRVGRDGRRTFGCVHSDGRHGPACVDSLPAPARFEEE